MIDTHTHIYLDDFEDGGVPAAERAFAAGVNYLVFPNIDKESVGPMLALHGHFPDRSSVALGLHPTSVYETWREDLAAIEKAMQDASPVAIGEVGIDLFWDKTYAAEQKAAFSWQLSMAKEMGLPVIIHCREALDEVLECIAKHPGELPQLLFHSFTGNVEAAQRILRQCDAKFGINGVATFKKSDDVRDAVRFIGSERIVFETDSPYLAPVPYRGRINESAYIMLTLQSVADTLSMPPAELERITDATARKLFNLNSV